MKSAPRIVSTAIQLPTFTRSTDEIMAFMDQHLAGQEERFKKKVLRIFKYAQVDRRYAIMPEDKVLAPLTFEEKNDQYVEAAIDLSEKVLVKALAKANMQPQELDYIITVSCTGFMIPSVDAYLINKLKMRQDIVRLPVTEMGCAAGVSALIYANDFLRHQPGKNAAIIAVESPMSTFQWDDFSMTNMVSAAIFGDGAACAILSSEREIGPAVLDTEMYHFYDATHMMGFRLKNSGFQMVLDPSVPETIGAHFDQIIHPFLEKNQLTIEDIDHLVFHPGGKKIVQLVEGLFGKLGKNLHATRSVLRDYGNMSSATVLYVLDQIIHEGVNPGDRGLMLSFGPGFSAQRILLEWNT
ncbi:MAG: 3-oxoacyl-[acyl-carrier-protein] synthase III C-terminal domain-containing protein [Bacteroidota bacterium]